MKGCSVEPSKLAAKCLTAQGPGGFAIDGLLPQLEHPLKAEEIMPIPAEHLVQAAFRGMRDSLDPTTADPSLAILIQNLYPIDTEMGAALVGRPGFDQAGAQLGAGADVQGIYQYTELDGTEHTIAVCNGKLYELTWGGSWADKSSGQPTTSTSAACYFVTMANKVIVSDGTNVPWTWDGTNFVALSNCPVLFGQPVVYYAKLFGIKNTERSAIVWSEENDPATGYEAGGYNNSWTLGQTDQEALYGLAATNENLFYFRARSIGSISGAVTTDFTNTGTREGVHETVGTMSPDAIVFSENKIYFLSADARPYVLDTRRQKVDPLWQDLRETIPNYDATKLGVSIGVNHLETEMVLLGVVDTGSDVDTYIAIDARRDQIAGLWTGFDCTAMAMVKDASGVPRLMHGSTNGYVYHHDRPTGSTWNDQANAADGGTVAISHAIEGSPLGYTIEIQKFFCRLDVSFRQTTTQTMAASYTTNKGASTPQNITSTYTGGSTVERHVAIGLEGYGRWARPKITHSSGVERFGILSWKLRAFPFGDEAGIP